MALLRGVFAGIVAMAIASTALAQAPSDDQPITHYGVTFPARFADGERIETRDFEPTNPGLGFSAGYRHHGAISTIYIYDTRLTSIPDDIRVPVVAQQFAQARDDIQRLLPNGSTFNSRATFVIADAARKPRLNCEGFDLSRSDMNQPLHTYLCLGVMNGKFFKVRTTMPQRSDSETEVRRFLGAWTAAIWKR